MKTPATNIRAATPSDLAAINEIYNHEVRTGFNAFDLAEKTLEDRQRWFAAHGGRHPVLVATEGETVVGWASLSPWAPHEGYLKTAEHSVFVHHQHQGKRIGRQLVEAIITAARALEYHTVIGRITAGNAVSLKLHQQLGFVSCGLMREVGFKNGRYLDVHVLQLMVN